MTSPSTLQQWMGEFSLQSCFFHVLQLHPWRLHSHLVSKLRLSSASVGKTGAWSVHTFRHLLGFPWQYSIPHCCHLDLSKFLLSLSVFNLTRSVFIFPHSNWKHKFVLFSKAVFSIEIKHTCRKWSKRAPSAWWINTISGARELPSSSRLGLLTTYRSSKYSSQAQSSLFYTDSQFLACAVKQWLVFINMF